MASDRKGGTRPSLVSHRPHPPLIWTDSFVRDAADLRTVGTFAYWCLPCGKLGKHMKKQRLKCPFPQKKTFVWNFSHYSYKEKHIKQIDQIIFVTYLLLYMSFLTSSEMLLQSFAERFFFSHKSCDTACLTVTLHFCYSSKFLTTFIKLESSH